MRKKYLSALLFGALLFASAGTFTSCKDYDDDINNLQEQINTIKTDLESLKATVDGLDGVKTLSFVDGTLIIETGKGTKVEVPVPSATDVEQTTVELDGQNLVVNGEVIGQVGDKVTVNEDGYLCVNGEATEIKAGKYAILENESDNTYTVSLPDAEGNMHTITLLKSVATNIRIDFLSNGNDTGSEKNNPDKGYAIFSEIGAGDEKVKQDGYGIAWGVASSDIDWKGPKGAVKAGQLLVGQQNEVLVNVYPANVELDKQTLKLVDVNGNAAPVIINASVADNAGGTTGSRAASNNGNWVLNITMDNTINGSNMGTAFASRIDQTSTSDWDKWENKKYALQVNGSIMTGYNYVIDTDEAACAMSGIDALWNKVENTYNGKVLVNDKYLDWEEVDGVKESKTKYSLGKEYELSFEQSSVYDYIFEIVDADENDAEAWGIKLENNVLYAENSTKAAGKTIHLNVKLLGVNGEVKDFGYTSATTTPIAVTFGKVTTDVITLPVSEFEVTPKQYDLSKSPWDGKYENSMVYTLDLGDLYSGLTAEEAIAVVKGETTLSTTDETFAFLRKTIVNKYGADNAGAGIKFFMADEKTEVSYDDAEANIRKIKYAKVYYDETAEGLWNAKATLGQHMLKLTLADASGNNIRTANVPVNVTVPSFFELFTKSAAWGDKTAVAVVDETGKVDLKQLYNDYAKGTNVPYFDLSSSFKANGETAGTLQTKQGEKVVEANTVVLNKYAADGHSLRDLSSKLIYKIVPECASFWVNSGDFTMDLVTKLDGAKFIYYVDGKEAEIVVEPESKNEIAGFQTDDKKQKQGLSFYKAGKDHPFETDEEVNGLKLKNIDNGNGYSYKFDDKAGDKAKVSFSDGKMIVEGLAKGDYTTELTITYLKASTFDNVDIWESFKINLTVKAK